MEPRPDGQKWGKDGVVELSFLAKNRQKFPEDLLDINLKSWHPFWVFESFLVEPFSCTELGAFNQRTRADFMIPVTS